MIIRAFEVLAGTGGNYGRKSTRTVGRPWVITYSPIYVRSSQVRVSVSERGVLHTVFVCTHTCTREYTSVSTSKPQCLLSDSGLLVPRETDETKETHTESDRDRRQTHFRDTEKEGRVVQTGAEVERESIQGDKRRHKP